MILSQNRKIRVCAAAPHTHAKGQGMAAHSEHFIGRQQPIANFGSHLDSRAGLAAAYMAV